MKTLILIFISLILYGCASIHTTYDQNLAKTIHLGMTKEQVYSINSSPSNWSRQAINGHVYESWRYNSMENVFDFVDNILVGYSTGHSGIYHSQSATEDVRNYPIK
jgi:uncharacterized protein YceK